MANRSPPPTPSKGGGCDLALGDGSRCECAKPVLFEKNRDPDIYANSPNSKMFKTNLKN